MTPQTPDEAYAAALDRLLDGLEADAAAGPEGAAAHAEVASDVAALSKALGLIGDALAAESAPAAAAPAAPIAAGGAGGGVVVPLAGRRPWRNPRVLAAAATLAFVVGFGIPAALSVGGGSDDESSVSAGAPADAVEERQDSDATSQNEAEAGTESATAADSTAGAVAGSLTPPEPIAPFDVNGTATSDKTVAKAAQGEAAPAPDAAAAPQERSSSDAFADSVSCARAIMIGAVTAITPSEDPAKVQLTVAVTQWISPASGPPVVSYLVPGPVAITSKGEEKLQIGDRRLFVIPGLETEVVRTFRQAEWDATRKRIARAQEQQAGADCP